MVTRGNECVGVARESPRMAISWSLVAARGTLVVPLVATRGHEQPRVTTWCTRA